MSILKPDEIRDMSAEERKQELENLKNELITEKGISAAGGQPENPGRIREIKKTIARIKTISKEEGDENNT
ncbi:50S ribosomal protein L29 [archaeon SCG-AAA382B04]|nr:50S ribosomal protein L29 [archaeon SCG-AAA382B04]